MKSLTTIARKYDPHAYLQIIRCVKTFHCFTMPTGYSTDSTWQMITWWRHQMETFSALLAICAGNSLATGEFPAQRPMTRSFDVFLELHLNKRLSKQWWGWWFETPSRQSWHRCNAFDSVQRFWNIVWQYIKHRRNRGPKHYIAEFAKNHEIKHWVPRGNSSCHQ